MTQCTAKNSAGTSASIDKVELAVGARGKLNKNVSVAEGLTNGTLLTVTSFKSDETVEALLETVHGSLPKPLGTQNFRFGVPTRS